MGGKIDLQLIFPSVTDHCANMVSCVTLALYNESRHWLEHSTITDTQTEDLFSYPSEQKN